MIKLTISALTVLVALVIMTTAQAQETTLTVISNDNIGNYLADGDGRTLYWHKSDSPGKSTCADECIQMWPAFYQEKVVYNLDNFLGPDSWVQPDLPGSSLSG